MNYHFLTLCFFIISNALSQSNYPQNYFQDPLDIPLYLSGTFGELRSNHFHSGLDIKTQQREGLNVLSSAQGYVSRIRVSHWGYGKALYITHPNGYKTVYAHLKKFSNKIEAYLKKEQYKKESFEIQLFPDKNALPINKGEVIAYSGSTGGFVGPHLHFEIRDGSARPMNPMLFGITVNDTKKPSINTLMAYPLDSLSQINQSNLPLQINFRQQENGSLLANKVTASGNIGFGINTFDRLNGALNKNGIYSLQLSVNGQIVYHHALNKFSFAESKYINLLIDYERYADLNQKVQQCFTDSYNPLSIYNDLKNRGVLTIKNGLSYNVEIIAKDFKGNEKKLIIPIEGKEDAISIKKKSSHTDYHIKSKEFNKFSKKGVTIAFPKNTFYDNFYMDFEVTEDITTIHKPNVPLNNNYTLTFDVSSYSKEEKKQLFIAKYNSKGKPGYVSTKKKENTFYTNTKSLGNFSLIKDTQKPSLKLLNFKNEQWLTNFKRLQLKVSDNLSGLKTYRGEIDGEWILLEYNPKKSTLTYDFSDKKFTSAKHQLKVIAIDNVGNTNTVEAIFYRKK